MSRGVLALGLVGALLFSALAPSTAFAAVAQEPAPSAEQAPIVDDVPPAQVPVNWSDETIDALGALPIQDGGRVKPLSTFAGFTLLRLAGRRTIVSHVDPGTKLGPDAFMMEVLVRPDAACALPLFLVAEGAAIDAIGLDASVKKRRDRWSFDELRPGIPRLFEFAQQWSQIDPKERSAVQLQVVLLAEAINQFLDLGGFLDFARVDLPVAPEGRLATLLGATGGNARFSQFVANGPAVGALYRELASSGDPLAREQLNEVDSILRFSAEIARGADRLTLIPPAGTADETPAWTAPGRILARALDGIPASDAELAALRGFEALARSKDDASASAALALLWGSTRAEAQRRGEMGGLDLERSYYKADPLTYALVFFLLGFVAAAGTWLRPQSKLLHRSAIGLSWLGLAFLIGAITVRCIIRGRPPVSTLYETVLFVTAVGALLALITEAIDRRRIAVSAAAALGAVGLFLAFGYEKLDAKDTMPELVAVLDTNFWLATHVTSITIGYAAGMLAALLGSIYVVGRVVRRREAAPEFFRSLARMVYGTICFGLIFSLVGTILGGLWANDSWGRFWGWDPKENGALLICLAMTSILHGRMGGHLKELGICVAAAFGGTVVAFSWWGVNLLGVGLHSYGFTSGVSRVLWGYYILQWSVCGLGLLVSLRSRLPVATSVPANSQASATKPGKGSAGQLAT